MDPADSITLPAGEAGATEMIIKAEGGKVIIRYREPRLWVAFDPQNAVQIGKHLIDCAVACGADVQIQVPRRKISREQRDRLVVRTTHIYRSLQEKNTAPGVIARSVVDTILSAIE